MPRRTAGGPRTLRRAAGTPAADAGRLLRFPSVVAFNLEMDARQHPQALARHRAEILVGVQYPPFVGKPAHDANVAVLAAARSEEHTSELQSLMRISYAVFRLKKKNK